MSSDMTARLGGARSSLAFKAPCRVATTANITLSGTQTIDGVAVVAEDRVLVKNQTTGADNGIYVAKALAWERARDFDGADDVVTGTRVYVHAGTAGSGEYLVSTADPITIGTTSITFTEVAGGGGGGSDLVVGTDVQAWDADLDAIAALAKTDGNFIVGDGSTWVVESGATARTSLGLGSLATASTINNADWSGTDLALANGGTGASLIDPNADRLMFWDDSAGAMDWLTLGTGLSITATTVNIDTELQALAGLTSASGKVPYFTGSGTADVFDSTTYGRSLSNVASEAALKALINLEAGTDFQAWDADLDALAALSSTGFTVRTGAATYAQRTITGTSAEITVADGTGVGGNPTISLPTALTFTGKTVTGGTFASPTAITGLPEPSSAQDAATKNYVDTVAQGLDPKPSVACATTANITLSGEQTIDGVLTSASRVLVKNQTAPEENGIYVSAAGAWSRATDIDNWAEVPGAYTFAEAGTTNADKAFVCTSDTGGTIGVTAMTWSQFGTSGTGSGITEVLEDTSPQLGGHLDTNAFNVQFDDNRGITDDSGNELLMFQKTASAVNQVEITNAATGNSPIIEAAGGDTNINLTLQGKGTGGVISTHTNTGLHILDTNASHDLIITPGSNLTADRTLTVTTGDADRTLSLGANLTVGAAATINGTAYIQGGYAYDATSVSLADGGTGTTLVDPNADRIMFWDDSGGGVDWLTVGTGLAITGTTIASTVVSPTTTRGDLIRRGASADERVALGTSGYALISDGTDPGWAGFTQEGTGATARTWQNKLREFLHVKDFGAVGDGTTDDTAAIQAAISRAVAVGGEVLLGQGKFLISGTGLSINESGYVAFTDAGDLVTLTGHGYINNDTLSFSAITSTTGISISTTYYVISATANTFQLSATQGGSALALTTNGTGYITRADDDVTRVSIIGEGSGASQFLHTGSGACITYSGSLGLPAGSSGYMRFEGFRIQGPGTSGRHGITIDQAAWFSMKDVTIFQCDNALNMTDVLSCQFAACQFRYNVQGASAAYSDGSRPNNITFLDCSFGANTTRAAFFSEPALVRFIGGSVEGNGTTTGAAGQGGISVSNAGVEGNVGLVCEGVYFEGNKGAYDVNIEHTANDVTHCFTNCSFARIYSSDYVTNNVVFACSSGRAINVVVDGCGFGVPSGGSYTEDAARPYFNTSGGAGTSWRLMLGANRYGDSARAPTASAMILYATYAPSVTNHGVALFTGTNGLLASTGAGTNKQILRSNGSSSDPSFSGLATVAFASTPTNHGVVLAGAADELGFTGAGTTGQLLTSNGASSDPTFQTFTRKQYVFGNGGDVTLNDGETKYLGIGPLSFDATISNVYITFPVAGTIRNLYCYSPDSPGSGSAKYTCTVRNASTPADTAVTCQILTGTNSASDLTNTATVGAGERFAVKFVASGGTTAGAAQFVFAFTFETTS